MKVGDIVYFKKPYRANYTTGHHEFYTDVKYKVIYSPSSDGTLGCCSINDPFDNTNHFMFIGGGYGLLINISEYREYKLNQIGINE